MRDNDARALARPRISAYDVFDEESWLQRIRNTLSSAIIARYSPRHTVSRAVPESPATPTRATRDALRARPPNHALEDLDQSPADLVLVDEADESIGQEAEYANSEEDELESLSENGAQDVASDTESIDEESELESECSQDTSEAYGIYDALDAPDSDVDAHGVVYEDVEIDGDNDAFTHLASFDSNAPRINPWKGKMRAIDEDEQSMVASDEDDYDLDGITASHSEDESYEELDQATAVDKDMADEVSDEVDEPYMSYGAVHEVDDNEDGFNNGDAEGDYEMDAQEEEAEDNGGEGDNGENDDEEDEDEDEDGDGKEPQSNPQGAIDEHMRVTSEALRELLSNGGIRDGHTGDLVDIGDFANNVVSVDQAAPSMPMSAAELFSAFRDRSGGSEVDIDELLQVRALASAKPAQPSQPLIEVSRRLQIISSEPSTREPHEQDHTEPETDRIEDPEKHHSRYAQDSCDANYYEDAESSILGRSNSQPIVVADSDGEIGNEGMLESFTDHWPNDDTYWSNNDHLHSFHNEDQAQEDSYGDAIVDAGSLELFGNGFTQGSSDNSEDGDPDLFNVEHPAQFKAVHDARHTSEAAPPDAEAQPELRTDESTDNAESRDMHAQEEEHFDKPEIQRTSTENDAHDEHEPNHGAEQNTHSPDVAHSTRSKYVVADQLCDASAGALTPPWCADIYRARVCAGSCAAPRRRSDRQRHIP